VRAPSSRVIVTGSARHAALADFDPLHLRRQFRSAIGVEDRVLAVFLGQPLWHVPGYLRTLDGAGAALARIAPKAKFLYRPHPKETAAERQKALKCIAGCGLDAALDVSGAVESALCAADLCLSCFSSAGLDHAHLSRVSTSALGSFLFLLHESDVRGDYAEVSRLDDIPLSALEVTRTVSSAKDLEGALAAAIEPPERERAWNAARSTLAAPRGAAQRILQTIADDLARTVSSPNLMSHQKGVT
jgi:hypothetical protein